MGVGGETPARLIPLATEFNKSVSGDADILASDITIGENGILRVGVALSVGTTFKLKLTRNTTTKILLYNSGSSLVADALYLFDWPVRKDDKINLRAGASVTVQVLIVDEIISMGP